MLAGRSSSHCGIASSPHHGSPLVGPAARNARHAVKVCGAQPNTTTTTIVTDGDKVVRDRNGRVVRRAPVTAADLLDHNTLFSSLLKEYAYWVEDDWVTGTIPEELCGTYYRNGPGLQIDNPRYRRHNFDGDGMILSLAFQDGQAYFRNRFVRTDGFVQEQAAGRPLFRNSFTRGSADGSMFFNPFDLSFKNVANTGVLSWAGKLYAMWEGGLPYRMDPVTLDTMGETRMEGALKGNTFGAHYRLAPQPDGSRRWVGFSTASGFGGSSITFYEFSEDGALLHETKQPLENTTMPFIHDMVVSEHYYIVVLGPIDFDAAKFATSYVTSRCSIAECLVYQGGKPARVVLVPRPGRPSGKVLSTRVMETDPCFVFHHANAFEVERPEAPGQQWAAQEPLVVLDTVAWDNVSFSVNQYTYGPDYYEGGARSHLVRMVCDTAAGTVKPHRLLRRTVEFPAVDPRVVGRAHSIVWAGCDMVDDPLYWGPNQAIARVQVDPRLGLPGGRAAGGGDDDATTTVLSSPDGTADGVAADVWYAGDRRYPGEPMFVPRPGSSREGDGWLLAAVHDAETQKGEVVILDAMNLSAGPVATIRLPHRLPAGLHGSWDTAYTGPDRGVEGAAPRWQELGSIRAL